MNLLLHKSNFHLQFFPSFLSFTYKGSTRNEMLYRKRIRCEVVERRSPFALAPNICIISSKQFSRCPSNGNNFHVCISSEFFPRTYFFVPAIKRVITRLFKNASIVPRRASLEGFFQAESFNLLLGNSRKFCLFSFDFRIYYALSY